MNLKHLTDQSLLEETKILTRAEREITSKLLHHLKEVERRKLFSDLKYGSMTDYLVKELGYSHAAAQRRIQASRMLIQLPEIEEKINKGILNLTNINQAASFFKSQKIFEPEKKRKILKKLENKTSREAEITLLKLLPEKPLPKETRIPITPEFTQLKINVSESTLKLLESTKSLMGCYTINDEYLKKLAEHALANITHKKFKSRVTFQNPSSRTLTNQTKREVYEKCRGVCEKCGGLFLLQFDHIEAFGLGGKTETQNLRLLCFHCNQRARIKTYNQDQS
jgi:hypothetical protein